MSEPSEKTANQNGSCLCGAVNVNVESLDKKLGVCHCSMCRKWGGGPFLAVDCGSAVTFEDEQSVSVFDSSMWAERGFCNKCGTHLFYRVKQTNQHIMPAGLFGDALELTMDHQIFIDEKPDYYCFSNETQNMTGAEAFAAFAPPE